MPDYNALKDALEEVRKAKELCLIQAAKLTKQHNAEQALFCIDIQNRLGDVVRKLIDASVTRF